MYLLAAFLLSALFTIRKQLEGSDFNSKAMIIHIAAVFLNFATGWMTFIADVFLHDERLSSITFLIDSIFSSTVTLLECYIFIQITRQLTQSKEVTLNDYGQFKIKKIRMRVSQSLAQDKEIETS